MDQEKRKPESVFDELLVKETDRVLNDPGFTLNKDTALSVCRMLISISIESKVMAEGSSMHMMALRLMDYIRNSKKLL